jgi:NRAMP (natural resistance-associated macrophage protein)-like metal ion transporter
MTPKHPAPAPGARANERHLGPGLITGAADDDPSGIATYSQAGAQFGFSMLWTAVLTLPLMAGIQLISARLGYVTGRGLAANIRLAFPRAVLLAIVTLLLLANTFNIAADVAAMGQALQLLLGGSAQLYAVGCGLLCLGLEVFLRYATYVRYLKWLTLSLLSYVAVAFTIRVPWAAVLRELLLPRLPLTHDTILIIVAVFGTTISPYLFFWQSANEMEDRRAAAGPGPEPVSEESPPPYDAAARSQLRRIRWDTWVGMGFSNLVAFFIILSTAATLHAAGVTHIQTSADAAEALRPLGGPLTFLLFSLGIIGTGLLAVPVLAGSAAYAVTETFAWREGLDLKLGQAPRFYALIALATAAGVALGFTRIDPIRALLWSAVINGVIAVPIMVIMMRLAGNAAIMSGYRIRRRLRLLGWAATLTMAAAVIAMLATL